MPTRKAASSFQACGSEIAFHDASSKPAASAPLASPTNSFQPGLKLYFARRFGGGSKLLSVAEDARENPLAKASEQIRTSCTARCFLKKVMRISRGGTGVPPVNHAPDARATFSYPRVSRPLPEGWPAL